MGWGAAEALGADAAAGTCAGAGTLRGWARQAGSRAGEKEEEEVEDKGTMPSSGGMPIQTPAWIVLWSLMVLMEDVVS